MGASFGALVTYLGTSSVGSGIAAGVASSAIGYGLSTAFSPKMPNLSVPPPPGAAMIDPAGSAAVASQRQRAAAAGGLNSTISPGATAASGAAAATGATAGGKTALGQ